ncbi:MFS transporter [Candidatus Pacearchaeota archaeon]|nr:MFS transporter [Candidatus Pacearchaeota archaeon]
MSKKTIRQLKERSRKYSIKDGFFTTVRTSVGDTYISPFAIALNASNSLIAIIRSVSCLIGPLSQVLSTKLIEKKSRKKIVLKAVFFESLLWIPMIIIAYLYHINIIKSILPLLMLLTFSVYTIFSYMSTPAWFSWMGDLVDKEYRGKWFSKRNRILGFGTIIFSIFAAIILDLAKRNNKTMFGFIILFSMALIARFIARHYLSRQYEPKRKIKNKYYFSFFDFLKKAHTNNYGKFSIFRALFSLAINIAGPFWTVYMLRNLGFNYVTFMMITIAPTVYTILVIRSMGKFSDRFGNYRVLCISSVLISFYPILWLLSHNPLYLILVPQLIGGIGWAGFNLAINNFTFDSVKPQKRSFALSYNNLMDGIGIFFGAIIGAILVKFLKIGFMDTLLFIFLISSLLRIIVSLTMIPLIREIRKTESFDSKKVFEKIIFHPQHHTHPKS